MVCGYFTSIREGVMSDWELVGFQYTREYHVWSGPISRSSTSRSEGLRSTWVLRDRRSLEWMDDLGQVKKINKETNKKIYKNFVNNLCQFLRPETKDRYSSFSFFIVNLCKVLTIYLVLYWRFSVSCWENRSKIFITTLNSRIVSGFDT